MPRRSTAPTIPVRRALALLACGASLSAWGCGPKNEPPPAPPKHASAADRIRLVGKDWREMSQSEAYLQSKSISWIRTIDQFTLRLGEAGPTGLVEIERTELMRTPSGSEYRCTLSGVVQAELKFEWRMQTAVVTVRTPPAALTRECKEPGFPIVSEQNPALNRTYVLRVNDRLEAIAPATLRSSLLPFD